MKRYSAMILLLSALLIILGGCAGSDVPPTTQTAGTSAAINVTESSITVDITTDSTKKSQIPDPATAGKEVSLTLPDQDYNCPQCDGEYEELCTDCKKNLFTDLSFAGFEKPVIATSFAVGSVTEGESCSFGVPDTKTGEPKVQKGTCLFLLVTNTDKEVQGDDMPWWKNDENYLVMLDYANKRCDKIKTDFEFDRGDLNWYGLNLHDLTGDGQEELVISYQYSKGWIDIEIFDFDETKQKLKKIFTSTRNNRAANDTLFSGQLLDNYQAVLEYKEISFSTTISLLNCGFEKETLDIDLYDGEYDLSGCPVNDPDWPVRLWKNGKLQVKNKKADTVFLGTMDKFSFQKTKEGSLQLRLYNSVMVGHRSYTIGDMYTYFQYNREKDSMELAAAEFKEYEDSEE